MYLPISKKLNRFIDRDVCKYNKDVFFTSDVYKDSQINEMYYLVDQISSNIDANDALANSIKLLFHDFRINKNK